MLGRIATQAARQAGAAGRRFASTASNGQAAAAAAEPFMASKTALFASSAFAAGSVALYASQFGIPGLEKAKAMTAAEEGLHPPTYPWSHSGALNSYDHASIRRGYQVYREVCSTCHSLDRIAWRNLVGVSHTVDEVKAMAEEVEYEDGPNDEGEMFQRPGKLADQMPRPYKNDEAARAGNAGALPPDLSLMIKARHGAADYVFALLTGYTDPPAGKQVADPMVFNPYFPGTAISMQRVLYDGLVEYPDGTPATTSQMAKDVVTFLSWASEPELDDRKRMGMQTMIILGTLTVLSALVKRHKWSSIKTRKLQYQPPSH